MTDPRELLQAFLDDELTAGERTQVEAALAADPALREELATLQAAGQLARASASPELPQELVTLIRDRIAESQRPWWERLLSRPLPHLTLGAATTLALCLCLAPLTRGPELPRLARGKAERVAAAPLPADGVLYHRERRLPPEAGDLVDRAGLPLTAPTAPAPDVVAPRGPAAKTGTSLSEDRFAAGGGVAEAPAAFDDSRPGPRAVRPESMVAELLEQTPPTPEETLPRLQAGEVDDNLLFGKYVRYAEQQAGLAGQGASVFPVRERYVIQVVEPTGLGVSDVAVRVFESGRQKEPLCNARTDASGQLVFLPGRYGTQAQHYVVRAGDQRLGRTVTFRRGEPGRPWRLDLSDDPAPATAHRTVDIAFVVDTTGSMSEEISRLRETIDQVVKLLDNSAERPTLRFGLVLYRDLGDAYVTKVYGFTTSVGTFRQALAEVQADGGGDGPEHVQAALAAAVNELAWSPAPAVRMAFLIGDAPPHLDYPTSEDNPPYLQSIDRARAKGIKFFTISSSGNEDVGEYVWRQIALLTRGKFLFITKGDALGDVPDRPAQPDDGATPHHVERQDYTVQALPNLIEQCVRRELAALGTKPPDHVGYDAPTDPQPQTAPQLAVPFETPHRKLPFMASLLIVFSNLTGWLWAWRRSLRPSLRRR